MMDFLLYEGKVAAALLGFYLFYRFLLKKETFHRLNRVVLVGTAVLSFLLPLCIITIHRPMETAPASLQQPMIVTELPEMEMAPIIDASEPWWPLALTILFWAGVAFVLVRVLISILSIIRIIRQGEQISEDDGCKIIVTERDIDPFSWMEYIVLSRKDWALPHQTILSHEKAHIAYGHSLDVLLADILLAFQWFNPAIWMLRADLKELHEYEADDAVLRTGANIKEYQYLLIRKAVSKSGYSVANSFNHSILKNRITMMSRSKSPLSRGLRVLWMLPLVCLAIGLQARTVYVPVDKDSENNPKKGILDEIVVVKYPDASLPAVTKEEHLYQLPEVNGLASIEEVDTPPVFSDEFNKWLNTRLFYPKECAHEGTVQISFVVDGNGKVGHVSILQGVCDELDNNVLNLVQKSPDWQPAMKGGSSVAVRLIQPVVFVIRSPQKEQGSDNSIMNVTTADQMPRFNGGSTELFDKWVKANLSYPVKAAANPAQGKVTVQGKVTLSFVISESGEVKDVKVLEGVDKEWDAEAVRVVSSSPKWTPAMRQGKPMATEMLYVVPFNLEAPAQAVVLNIRADGTIESGDKVYTVGQLKEIIPPHKDGEPLTTVHIVAEDNVRMGVIEDVKGELRKLGALPIRYYSSASGQERVTRHMPPFPRANKAKKSDYPEVLMPGVKRENIFIVRINSRDKIFFGDRPLQDEEEMFRAGKEFLRKRGNDAHFLLTVDRGTSYGAYTHMQSLLWQVYEEIRDEKAHEVYGKALSELSNSERSQINWMVPFSIAEASPKSTR